jgi:phosphopantetheinyl transferase
MSIPGKFSIAANEIVIAPYIIDFEQREPRVATFEFFAQVLELQHLEVTLVKSELGRPEISAEHQDTGLDFNVSYAANIDAKGRQLCLIAAARGGRVGVDVEQIDRQFDIASAMKPVFCDREIEFVQQDRAAARVSHDRFYKIWTRKESLLKALGVGMSVDARSIDCHGETGTNSRHIRPRFLTDEIADQTGWSIVELPAGNFDIPQTADLEFATALTTDLDNAKIRLLPIQVLGK